ncbi:class Ib ribonucleoside-diphosphate reductase assembly flavoprotein NrdI [Paenibacillus polymyxa]|uniref:NrdI protein n=1 Tax=Paenibacillus polymyxa TaxID=1406 RepID=A0A378Y0V6_PAEPO|nr:class Ib ribonucleoside-diphosphate reductase assembly flavoprotein NrdI [Paenibacillus polymyxa]MBE7896081.1 class Ib ribonucleoside-diphosphate reductase assembly flavoprotein NrdI [Paenibacillus polymyxa]MBG9765968.1 ribonucleotide reductase stimulatory protein [Paenibacillus polymyxa]MCC3256616.1 class Ib ribonucleoside-diphosphate reductase assembly flavoprotein NrdI [Paenibacillus polymyxa]QPK54897.1 class Ib ribonucleoside-diphosphate reductase assembly flavoprotein NrdI [Paenibacillu
MLIIYDSLTGNVERFTKKLEMKCVKIVEGLIVDEPYVLITYTTGFGQVPLSVEKFLRKNNVNLKGVIGSGNMNWGSYYNGAAKKISEQYETPLIHTFELSGNLNDIEKVKLEVTNIV